jgi:hypothetical protein
MILPKLISSRVIQERYYSSTGTQNELNSDDFRLWVAEIYQIMGFPGMLMKKVIGHKQDKRYDFHNYTVPLPCDFYALCPGGIAVNGDPVRWTQSAFHYLMKGDCCGLDELNDVSLDIFIDQFGNEFSPQAGAHLSEFYQDVTFDIYNNQIVFNIKKGKVCMAYWSLPLDNENYLMIPDDEKFKRALTDYVIWKNDYILWRQQAISDKMYQESRDNKDWSIASAANHIKLPDVEQLESMKDTMIRLIPKSTSYWHFFKDLGTQENRRLN